VVFRAKVKERDKVVISNAAIEFFAELPKPKEKKQAAAAPSAGGAPAALPNSADVFAGIAAFVKKNGAEAVAAAKTIFAFKLKSPDSVWTLDLKNGAGMLAQGEPVPAECTFEIADADFLDMVRGKADAMKLFTTGKLKISGNVMASQKLGPVLKNVDPKDVLAAAKARSGGAAAAPAASGGGGAPKAAQASAIVEKLGKRIADNAGLVKEVGAVIELRVKDPDDTWTIDLKNGGGSVAKGGGKGADAVVTIADADLALLASGGSSAQSLYQHGKLRIDGDARIAPRLSIFNKLA
jgi:3-hydroxyacyl-CoA dehydrogenase/3a,7a,12a-trihydroxy-5b-cholest-24-enoyl-CoA hydratase